MTARPGCWPRAVRAAARTATSARRVLERALPSMIWAVIGGLGGGNSAAFLEGAGAQGACCASAARLCGRFLIIPDGDFCWRGAREGGGTRRARRSVRLYFLTLFVT